MFKIPLVPTDLGTADASNNVAAFPSVASKLVNIGLPTSGPTSMSLDGLPIFPPYNDNSGLAWASCEMDGCNAHVGQGFDYHYVSWGHMQSRALALQRCKVDRPCVERQCRDRS